MGGRIGKFHYITSFSARESACSLPLTNCVKVTRNRERVNCQKCLLAMGGLK